MTNHPIRGLRLALATVTAAAAASMSAATVNAQDPTLADVADALLDARMPARDDADAVVERLLEVARANARSPASALLVDSIGRVLDDVDAPRQVAEGLASLLTRDQLHGATRDAAASLLHRLSRILDGPDASTARSPWADFATRWLAVGPFGDSGDFFGGVVFAPEAGFPRPGTELQGRFGAVEPRVVEREPQRREVALGDGAADPSGCEYGLHQVRAAAATAGYAQLVTRGSFELFVNDVQVRRLDRLQERTTQVVHVPVRLRAGVNHIVVKTTLASRDDVGLRYVDARGWPLPGLEELTPDRVHARAEAAAADDAPPLPPPFIGPLDTLLRAARRAPPDAESQSLAAALVAFELGATDAGDELLFARTQRPPVSARAQLALAEVWRAASDVPQEIRDGEARRLLEAAADDLPGHHFVTMRRADLLRGDDRIEDAIKLVQRAMADRAAGPATWDKLVDLYDALDASAEAEVTRRAWLAAHPLDVRPRQALARGRATAGDPVGALALVDAGLAALPGHSGLLSQALGLAVDLGDRARALALLDRIHADDPESDRALSDRARSLFELGDTEGAIALWNRRAAAPDARAGELRDVGMSLWRSEARDDAQRALAKSVAQEPSQHDLQRLLARLDAAGGDAPEFPRIARFRIPEPEIDRLVREFVPTEREAAAPSTLVLDSMIVEFLADGGYVQEVHQLRRINDLSGVEAHEEANAAARADELVRLRTIGKDGSTYVPKRVGGTFAMPRLEPGAFIEELWRERFDAPGADPWRGPSFLFRGQDEAFLRSELVLILPPGHPGSVRARGLAADEERVPLDTGYEALRFAARDVPRLRPERLTPPLEELVPVVVYGEDRAPGAQARLARVGAAVRTRVTPWVSATAAAIVDGIDGDTARARAIHAWVHENIATERGSPDPTATLLRRQGPRFFLEVAMLTAAGVPLRPASSTASDERMSSDAPPLFVGDTEFAVPAARLEPRDGPVLWLFADLPRHAPLGLVSGEHAGAAALLADSGALTRVPDASEGAPGWKVDGRITLGAEGDAILDVELELSDEPGYALAQRVRDLDSNRRTLVGRSIGAQLFEGWTVMESALAEPVPGTRFRARLKLRRRGALQQASDVLQLALPMPRSEAFQRYGDPGPRELPLRLTGKTIEEWNLTVELGAALRPVGLPEGARVVGPMLDYELSFLPDPEGVRIRRRFAVRPGTIQASRFGEWTHELRRIDRAEDARIELRRG